MIVVSFSPLWMTKLAVVGCIWDGKHTHAHTHARAYRVIDSPHQDAHHRVTGAEKLHVLLHKVFLFRLSLGRQSAQSGGDVGRRHGPLGPVRAALCGASPVLLCKAARGELRSCGRCSRLLQQQVQGNFLVRILFYLLPLCGYILMYILLSVTLLVVLTAHMLYHPKPTCFKVI